MMFKFGHLHLVFKGVLHTTAFFLNLMANSADPAQTSYSVASNLELYCLLKSLVQH